MTTLFKQLITLSLLTYSIGCNPIHKKTTDSNSQTESLPKRDSASNNRLKKLKLQLQNADSILLVSHGQTYGPILNKRDSSYTEAKPIVESGIINKKVIKRTELIEGQQREELIDILTQEVKGEIIDLALCFDPHHAFILISKKDISYIEFCFTCGGVATDNLEISGSDFDKEKWDRIYKYIDRKISIKE